MKREILAGTMGVVGALVIAGCAGTDTGASNRIRTTTSAADDKYTQTWQVPYDKTTCIQFKTEMTAKQRWAMAADMLTGTRNVSKENSGLPSDAMIDEFERGLLNVCVIDTMNMADAGLGLYMTEPRFHP